MGFKSEQKNLTFSDLERSFKDEKTDVLNFDEFTKKYLVGSD